MVDHQVDLSVVGYQPASDLASVHGQDSSGYWFLSYLYSAGFRIRSIDEVLGCSTVYQGCSGTFLAIGSLYPYFDHYFSLSVVSGCPDSVGRFFFIFRNWLLPRVTVARVYSGGLSFPDGFSSVSSSNMASAALYGIFHRSHVFLGWGHSLEKCPFFPKLYHSSGFIH